MFLVPSKFRSKFPFYVSSCFLTGFFCLASGLQPQISNGQQFRSQNGVIIQQPTIVQPGFQGQPIQGQPIQPIQGQPIQGQPLQTFPGQTIIQQPQPAQNTRPSEVYRGNNRVPGQFQQTLPPIIRSAPVPQASDDNAPVSYTHLTLPTIYSV